jgi:hypothetical protein
MFRTRGFPATMNEILGRKDKAIISSKLQNYHGLTEDHILEIFETYDIKIHVAPLKNMI